MDVVSGSGGGGGGARKHQHLSLDRAGEHKIIML